MNAKYKNIALVGCLSAACISNAYAQNWSLSPNREVGFSIQSLGMTVVKGDFGSVNAKMQFDPKALQNASTQFTMQVDSLKLSKPSLKNMIMGEDLFYAAKYKTVNFKSTQFKSLGNNRYQILGNLTLRGVTKPVVFDTTLTPNASNPNVLKVTSKTVINRSDFGMKKAVAGVGEKVNIHLNGQWNTQ
ncbi:hypothetical protein A3K93_08050 [Acinetobacter sp. NCu2D-2]|uniref:YceI family protein n=1 Tax=Acinetobacter sp. NCu2D-2 TaxID=1608473 RepID=UPI0007CDD468|nr:YceI family protein [Acinetobacter sp. NCu2D-2]ANF83140.1 hypothetical protein A3K93_08050 [Acinetobacter sp. NCu2D-2]